MAQMTDPMLAGYAAYSTHQACALLNGYAHAANLDGATAIKYHLPPEAQDAFQFARPHDQERVQWMRGWDNARSDAAAGKVDEPSAHLPDLYPFVTGEGE